jgi:hypothetical protein
MSTAHGRNRDNGPLGKKLKNLYDLIEGIEIAKDRTRNGVSVSGTATISQNRLAIREFYQRDWKAWFGDQGGSGGGGPEDPRLGLVLVDVQSVVYLKVTKPAPVVLFEVAKGLLTGTPPNVGAERQLSGGERE